MDSVKNKSILERLAEAIKNLAGKIKEFILNRTTNKAARIFAQDAQALYRLAEMFSNAADKISGARNENGQKNNTGEGVDGNNVKYSIVENIENKDNGEIYDKVVALDTNIFKGISPRNWGNTFREFIKNNLIGKKILVFDENGNEEIIEFAKPNERVTKEGAKNEHKVIDKLARKPDNYSKLVIVHSEEVIKVSTKQNDTVEHKHQWLDENGWEYRNAYVMDNKGNIYSVTLNIAKTKDGRNILYDINKIDKVGHGVVLSNAKGKRSSHINPNFVKRSVTQSENNVKKKDDKYSVDDTITQSEQFVKWFGDWQNNPKSASKIVDGSGEPLVVYHQTDSDFTVFDTSKKGAGEYDSEMPTGIFMKPTPSNIGLSGDRQMALYAKQENGVSILIG